MTSLKCQKGNIIKITGWNVPISWRAHFQAALAVCDAISQAMDERNKATVSQAAGWPQRSAQLRQNIEQLVARQKAAEASAPSPPPSR